MNNFLSGVVYLTIGGLLVGGVTGDIARKCGHFEFGQEEFMAAALWPVMVGAALRVGKVTSQPVCKQQGDAP